jgi:hypothetical protein
MNKIIEFTINLIFTSYVIFILKFNILIDRHFMMIHSSEVQLEL